MIQKLATRHRFTASTIITATLLAAPQLFAADAPAKKTLLDKWVIDGGWTMIFIGIAVVAFIGLTVYNYMTISKAKYCPADLKAALMEHMIHCRVRSAIELAASHPSYLGRLVAYAFPNIDATHPETLGRDQVEDAIADFTTNEAREAMQWINYISLTAQASPMLGLLGTVIGMVGCFATLGTSGAADPAQLAGDISVALLTTLWGLLNAIPCILFFFILKNRYNATIADVNRTVEELLSAAIATVNADTLYAKIPEGIDV